MVEAGYVGCSERLNALLAGTKTNWWPGSNCGPDNRHSLSIEATFCLEQEAKAPTDLKDWLERVDAMRAQARGDPIPVDDLVAEVERNRP